MIQTKKASHLKAKDLIINLGVVESVRNSPFINGKTEVFISHGVTNMIVVSSDLILYVET